MRRPVRPAVNRAASARAATCGTLPAPAALARGPSGGYRVSDPRGGISRCVLDLRSTWGRDLSCRRGLRAAVGLGAPRCWNSIGQSLDSLCFGPRVPKPPDGCPHPTGFSTSDPKEPGGEPHNPLVTTLRPYSVLCSCTGDMMALSWLQPKYSPGLYISPITVFVSKDTYLHLP